MAARARPRGARRAGAALGRTPAGGYAPLPMQPLRDESATEVRRRIAAGEDWSAMVPPAVAGYIRAQGLYGRG